MNGYTCTGGFQVLFQDRVTRFQAKQNAILETFFVLDVTFPWNLGLAIAPLRKVRRIPCRKGTRLSYN